VNEVRVRATHDLEVRVCAVLVESVQQSEGLELKTEIAYRCSVEAKDFSGGSAATIACSRMMMTMESKSEALPI
jgi:hypothetical protein